MGAECSLSYSGVMLEIRYCFMVYLNGYIKAVRKKRWNKEPLYRVSSLQNFNKELGL